MDEIEIYSSRIGWILKTLELYLKFTDPSSPGFLDNLPPSKVIIYWDTLGQYTGFEFAESATKTLPGFR